MVMSLYNYACVYTYTKCRVLACAEALSVPGRAKGCWRPPSARPQCIYIYIYIYIQTWSEKI